MISQASKVRQQCEVSIRVSDEDVFVCAGDWAAFHIEAEESADGNL